MLSADLNAAAAMVMARGSARPTSFARQDEDATRDEARVLPALDHAREPGRRSHPDHYRASTDEGGDDVI